MKFYKALYNAEPFIWEQGYEKSYWEQVLAYLEKHGKITNREIIQITNTNCPHSVIRDVKKHGVNLTCKIENGNGKTYKVYFFEGTKTLRAETPKPFKKEEQMALDLGAIPKLQETESERRNRMLKTFGYC